MVESVKAAADLYMPVSGEVVEVNEALRADPSLANTRPARRRLVLQGPTCADTAEFGELLDAAAYDELREERLSAAPNAPTAHATHPC